MSPANDRTAAYEEAFARHVGADKAWAFGRGREGLFVLLRAIGVEPGDGVGVCGYTCLAVVEAVKTAAAVPVYLDVDESMCIDPEQIRGRPHGSLRAVILQHTFGWPGRLDELLDACRQIGAAVIEDCAHAFDCFWKGRRLGSVADGAIYSSQWSKPYSTGLGGMLTVNTPILRERVEDVVRREAHPAGRRAEFVLGLERLLDGFVRLRRAREFLHDAGLRLRENLLCRWPKRTCDCFRPTPGFVRRMGPQTAGAGLRRLQNWSQVRAQRRRNMDLIEKALSAAGLPLWPRDAKADVTPLCYPALVADKEGVLERGRREGLDIRGGYSSGVDPLEGESLRAVGYRNGDCPRARQYVSRLVCLPAGPTFREDMLGRMIELIAGRTPVPVPPGADKDTGRHI